MADGRRRRDVKETYDLGLGFVGFFTVAFVGVVIWEEAAGRDAVWASITALLLGAVEFGIWVLRRRYLERSAEQDRARR